jgi:hypothetical protein
MNAAAAAAIRHRQFIIANLSGGFAATVRDIEARDFADAIARRTQRIASGIEAAAERANDSSGDDCDARAARFSVALGKSRRGHDPLVLFAIAFRARALY